MIGADHVRLLARYNKWQNGNLYAAAGRLTDAERRLDRGAFFGSIHATLCHVLWGDRIWMHRFAGWPAPEGSLKQSPAMIEAWPELGAARAAFDDALIGWADALDPASLAGELRYYSLAAGRDIAKPLSLLVAHMFNHQTHHRGQVHCMLTQCGQDPGDTDLPLMPA